MYTGWEEMTGSARPWDTPCAHMHAFAGQELNQLLAAPVEGQGSWYGGQPLSTSRKRKGPLEHVCPAP